MDKWDEIITDRPPSYVPSAKCEDIIQ